MRQGDQVVFSRRMNGASRNAADRARALQPLYELTDAVARAVALEEVYSEAVRVVASALGVDRAALLVADDDGIMRFRAWQGLSEGYRARTEGHSPWSPAEKDPLPLVIEDVAADEILGDLRDVVLSEGIGALAFIPLVGRGGLQGKLMLYYDAARAFSDEELRLVSTIASSVAVAIGRREVEAELRESRDQLGAIFAAVADGITVLDREGKFVLANDAAARLCGFDTAEEMLATPMPAIMERFEIFDEEGEVAEPHSLPPRRVLAGEPYAEKVLRYRLKGAEADLWSHVKASPVAAEGGAPRFAVTVFRDITAEREANEHSKAAMTQLSRLERIADVALRASTLDELLGGLLEVVRAVLHSDRATMLLLEGTNELTVRAAVGIAPDVARGVRVPVGEGIAGTIAATRTPHVFDDLSKLEVVSSYLRERGGSLAGVPLLFQDRLLGVLHVSSARTNAFSNEDLEYLKLAAERAAIAIEQARLFERERDLAASLQQSLLPERFPSLPGVTVAASYLPALDGARVGGDWYDAFPLGDGRIMIAIGDIVGHGIEAAAAMGQVRNALRAFASENPSPASVFSRINGLLCEAAGQEFCTAFCAIVDPWARTITYADAGHPEVLVVTPTGDARFLKGARSTPLGALRNARYEEATEALEPGSVILAYTDGLVEDRREGLDKRLDSLARAASAAVGQPLRSFPDAVRSELLVDDGARPDDVAMLATKLIASDDLRLRLPAEPSSLPLVRGALGSFLGRAGVAADDIFDLKVACGEACLNVIEHAYGTGAGIIRLNATATNGGISISVADSGRWRDEHPSGGRKRGHGLALMNALTDDLRIVPQEPTGTEVRMFRRLER